MITYKFFNTIDEASFLIDLLKLNKIEFQIIDNSPSVDATITGGNTTNNIEIKVFSTDYTRVEKLVEKAAKSEIDTIDAEYYLYDFNDKELIDILENYNEWSPTDRIMAQKILKERGQEYSEEDIKTLKAKKIKELSQPEKGKIGWLIFGFISAIFGGLLGIFIGYHHYNFKKSIPNGKKVHAYDAKTRKIGFRIFLVGIVSLVFWISIKLLEVI